MSLEGYTYNQLKPLVKEDLLAGDSVLMLGKPGVGKSTMGGELAEEFKLPFVDIRIGQKDPAEIGGMGYPNRETGYIDWLKPNWFPKDDKPFFLFLDEINAGVTKLHQSVCYQLMLDKAIGGFSFPKGTMVMGAGNLEEDRSIVTPLSAALMLRTACYVLEPSVSAWLKWAGDHDVPEDYQAYVAFVGDKALYEDTGERTFPCPRSNARAALATKDEKNDTMRKQRVAARIGNTHAQQYMTFRTVYKNVNIKDIIDHGKMDDLQGKMEGEPSFAYALVYSVAQYVSGIKTSTLAGARAENIVKLISFFNSKVEYQSVFFRMLVDLLGKKKGVFDALRTVPDFAPLAANLSTVLSSAA